METVITMQAIFFVLWSVSIFLVKRLINDMKEDIKKNIEDLNEVKTNYIDRFEKIRDKQNESVMTLMQKLHETEMRIVNEIAKFKNNDTSNH